MVPWTGAWTLTTTVGTEPFLVEEVGPPPWSELAGQESCKYAVPDCANSIAKPWVRDLILRMRSTLPYGTPLIDIRWWEHLEVNDLPGIARWHYDCYNELQNDHPAQHRLYFYGAGSRTMFESGYQPPEGWIVGYDHQTYHCVMPATTVGPRLLVRVSHVDLTPANRIGPPPLFHKGKR